MEVEDENKNAAENNDLNVAVADITDKVEFAKDSFGYIGSGGIVSNITSTPSSDGYAVFVSWHVGIPKGNGEAFFEGDGSALLAVEILKDITFGNKNCELQIQKSVMEEMVFLKLN